MSVHAELWIYKIFLCTRSYGASVCRTVIKCSYLAPVYHSSNYYFFYFSNTVFRNDSCIAGKCARNMSWRYTIHHSNIFVKPGICVMKTAHIRTVGFDYNIATRLFSNCFYFFKCCSQKVLNMPSV